MKLAVLTLALLLAVGAYGQIPKRCESPPTWEARVLIIDPAKRSETLAQISYDAPNQRFVSREEIIEPTGREYYEDIRLHREKRGYKINLRTRQCTSYTLSEAFSPIEVPTNATFYGEAYLGSSSLPGSGVLLALYGGESTRGRYSGSWTAVDCVPVSDSYVSTLTGFVHWTFFDVTLGIANPNVFIPPSECT